jgi:hypothetical protein
VVYRFARSKIWLKPNDQGDRTRFGIVHVVRKVIVVRRRLGFSHQKTAQSQADVTEIPKASPITDDLETILMTRDSQLLSHS